MAANTLTIIFYAVVLIFVYVKYKYDRKIKFHYHTDENGILVKCYHWCSTTFSWQFWLGITFSFPFEHLLWEKIWPFSILTKFLGL